jgi:hypothetical protein
MLSVASKTVVASYLLWQACVPPTGDLAERSSTHVRLVNYIPYSDGVRVSATADKVRINDAAVHPLLDAWSLETQRAIAAHRDLPEGWDGITPSPTKETLDTAEMLVQAFSSVPVSKRPLFSVDTTGCPSFSSYNDEIYLHLTIDGPGLISWYSVKDSQEIFRDAVEIDGFNLDRLAFEILMIS